MKNACCPATALYGSAALPFVFRAQPRDLQFSRPLLEMFFDRAYPDFLLRGTNRSHVWGFLRRNKYHVHYFLGSLPAKDQRVPIGTKRSPNKTRVSSSRGSATPVNDFTESRMNSLIRQVRRKSGRA
jgi:hypothetical protein